MPEKKLKNKIFDLARLATSRMFYLFLGIGLVMTIYTIKAAWSDNVASNTPLTAVQWNDLKNQVNRGSTHFLVLHSQTNALPAAPTVGTWTKLWDGYSLAGMTMNLGAGTDSFQDLGSPGSCATDFRAIPFVECNNPNNNGHCDYFTGGDYSMWLSAVPGDDEGGFWDMRVLHMDKISRCSVYEGPQPVLVRHSQTGGQNWGTFPPAGSGWTVLQTGYSFAGVTAAGTTGGQDLGSTGSCLPHFRAMPMIECDHPNGNGHCDFYTGGDFSMWLYSGADNDGPNYSDVGGANEWVLSECAIWVKI